MNLPNKLTMFRVILILPFCFFLMTDFCGEASKWIALGIFIVASLTDLLDGKIARKYNLVTTFGKFMDPLADKLLVSAAMIALIELKRIPAWVVIVIISREFIISGFRLIAADNHVVLAAGWLGKIKTTLQCVSIVLLLLDNPLFGLIGVPMDRIALYLAAFFTLWSLIDYLYKNRKLVSTK